MPSNRWATASNHTYKEEPDKMYLTITNRCIMSIRLCIIRIHYSLIIPQALLYCFRAEPDSTE